MSAARSAFHQMCHSCLPLIAECALKVLARNGHKQRWSHTSGRLLAIGLLAVVAFA